MKKSSILTLSLIIITIGIIVIATSKKVYDNHRDNSFRVVEQRIEEAARKCILEEECSNKMTIDDLIQKKYLNRQVHPITKEFVDNNLVILCEDYTCDIDIRN